MNTPPNPGNHKCDAAVSEGLAALQAKVDQLQQISIALASENDPQRLLGLILSEMRRFTGADAGSLYILEEGRLVFRVSQNDTLAQRGDAQPFQTHTVDLTRRSIAGQCCLSGEILNIPDVYHLPEDVPFAFNSDFDTTHGYRTQSMLAVPLTDSQGNVMGVVQLINAKSPGGRIQAFDPKLEKQVVSLACQAAVAIRNATLVAEVAAKNEELKNGCRTIEEANRSLDDALRKVKTVRNLSAVFALVIFVSISLYFWHQTGRHPAAPDAGARPATDEGTDGGQWVPVSVAPLATTIAVPGTIGPMDTLTIPSPFGGKIRQVLVRFGSRVTPGQVLLRMDTEALQTRLRKATAARIRTVAEVKRLVHWQDSPEMRRARRAVTRSEMALAAQQARVQEAAALSAKQIVPEREYLTAKDRLANLELDLRSARAEMEAVAERGDADAVQIAQMEEANAAMAEKTLRYQLALANVCAPVAGIVMDPNIGRKTDIRPRFAPGSYFEQGEVLLAIGDMTGIAVTAQIGESDIGKVRLGQAVRVQVEAFSDLEFDGRLSHISYQAVREKDRPPYFDARVTVPQIMQAQRKKVFMGMTALLKIVTYENPRAVVVPATALVNENFNWYVTRRAATGKAQRVPVTLGASSYDRVEILSGINPGDQIRIGR